MSLEALLSRLEKVKGRNGSYTACCPAHDDKSPSLAIREQDGKVLLHCFGGCETGAIVAALGMEMTDLFPPNAPTCKPQQRAKFFASDLLRVIAVEAQIVRIGAYDISHGKALSEADRKRLLLACSRIGEALESANG